MRRLVTLVAALCSLLALPAVASAEMVVTKVASPSPGDQLVLTSTTTGDAGEERWEIAGSTFDGGSATYTLEIRDAGLDGINDTLPAGCSENGNVVTCDDVVNRVVADMGPEHDEFAFDLPITESATVEVNGGDGGDLLSGGPGADQVWGGPGADQLTGGAGPDEIDGYNGFGRPATDPDGPDVMGGGADEDTMYDTGNTDRDAVDYSDARPAGVTVTMDGQMNDGHPTFDGEGYPNPMTGGDTVGGGIEDVLGTIDQNDSITGDSQNNYLSGYGGNDTLTGGGGHDELFGNDGDDTLNARDDTSDPDVNCGPGTDSATVDAATVDTKVTDCETVDRTGGSTNTNTGGGGTTGGGTTGGGTTTTPKPPPITDLVPKKPVEIYPVQEYEFPNLLRGTRACGRKRYCLVRDVKRILNRRKLNYELDEDAASDKTIAKLEGKIVKANEIVKASPKSGATVKSGPEDAFEVDVETFSPQQLSKCDLKRPFIRIGNRVVRLTDHLKGLSPRKAEEALADANCKRSQYEIQDKVSRKVTDTVVTSAKIVRDDARRVRLTVSHGSPEIMFTYTKPRLVSGYIPVMWGDNNEIVIPQGEPTTLEVTPTKSGMGLTNLWVSLRDSTGEQVEYDRTRSDGSAELDMQIDKSGKYELWTSLCDQESDCIVGWKRIDVAKLDTRRTYLGLDGLTYGQSGGRWKPVATAASARAHAAQAADRASLGTLASEIVTRVFTSPLYRYAAKKAPNGPLYQAVLKLNAAASAGIRGGMAGYYDALVKAGIEFTIMAGGGNSATSIQRVDFVRKEAVYSDGDRVVTVPIYAIDTNNGALALKVDNIMLLPGGLFYLVTGGGISAGANQAVTQVNAIAGNLDLVNLNGATGIGLANPGGAASLIGADGGSLIGMDGASLIGMDGASLIGMDGASLIGMDGASLIGADGASLIGMDGASLIGADGASLIGADGASLLPGY